MLELDRVSHAFEDGRPAIVDVSFRIDPGERVVLLGPNGCGKTTVLKLLDGLVFPDQGYYRLDGEPVTAARLRERAWARRFRARIALLFQNPDAMLFHPTVREEIAYGPSQLGHADAIERAEHWARSLGLGNALDEPPYRLSGGEKQKVCLAALAALEPEVLLLDEPTANLDPRSAGQLVDLLPELAATTIVTTHNLSLAPELGRRCLILSEEHRLLFDGSIEDALAEESLLIRANLVHRHRHRHGELVHSHFHRHDWS
jgi:cobalt/nickel transport system ATP-binding protein